MLGKATAHAVSVTQVEAWLSVQTQVSDFFFAAQQDFDLHRIRHYQRAMRERMRGNRRYDERLDTSA